MTDSQPVLQIHMEPKLPIEVKDLTAALGSLARQYDLFIKEQSYIDSAAKARLLVSAVSPGSIDINLIADIHGAVAIAAPFVSDLQVVSDFATHTKSLLEKFTQKLDQASDSGITVKDCDDAINIAGPIAKSGGSQVFNIYNGPVTISPVFAINSHDAQTIVEEAVRYREKLKFPDHERRQRVSMIWKRLDRDPATIDGRSPDKALIEEISSTPKPVFFTDELSYLKDEMIRDVENPYKKVYFVDVEISRVGETIMAYRVVGYYGNDDIE